TSRSNWCDRNQKIERAFDFGKTIRTGGITSLRANPVDPNQTTPARELFTFSRIVWTNAIRAARGGPKESGKSWREAPSERVGMRARGGLLADGGVRGGPDVRRVGPQEQRGRAAVGDRVGDQRVLRAGGQRRGVGAARLDRGV